MRFWGHIAFAAAALTVCSLLYAQSGDPKTAVSAKATDNAAAPARGNAKKDAKARPPVAVTPESEAAVITFVQRNHAELADLLVYLRTSQPEEYERAIKEIFRTTQRLAAIQERDPLQYELEVVAWTAQSRVQLLAAKLKMGSSDDLVKQLRAALQSQNTAKVALLKHERQKMSDRLEKIESDITRLEANRDDIVDRQLKLLTRAAAEGRPVKTAKKKSVSPSATKPAN
jgi:hypothetical protein